MACHCIPGTSAIDMHSLIICSHQYCFSTFLCTDIYYYHIFQSMDDQHFDEDTVLNKM